MGFRFRAAAAVVSAGAIITLSTPVASATYAPATPGSSKSASNATKLNVERSQSGIKMAQRSATIHGITFAKLPQGLGAMSTFESTTDDDTAVVSQVWESEDEEGWTVDLSISVYRSPGLTSPRAFHDWLVPWQERPVDEAQYRRTIVRRTTVWIGHDQAFWLAEPGVGVSVRLDTKRWSIGDLHKVVHASVPN
ncbi:hypothetical protein [Yimella sp. cx-51]|uniref:hypothetical protein n=1 Tax=Yimella sp. cx-51 TaxID=2770551 RepID=UPI00165EB460|nr:hypothetical protein [Yimella sp. cx-51]MBC9955668.1 hypothetical protein [Yimella sp. cx-51]QTH37761.1 hypothetical protein J5M86_13050 [Yimella sp. cx-51]